MDETASSPLAEICAQLNAQKLPRWQELPDLELYMDQVLALIRRYLGSWPGFDEKGLTASMVNNYVKMGAMPAPDKKRYARRHLAYLLVICILKPSLPIAAIRRLIEQTLENAPAEAAYDRFCALFEQTGADVAAAHAPAEADGAPDAPVFRAALRAQAETALALRLYAAYYPEERKGESEEKRKK